MIERDYEKRITISEVIKRLDIIIQMENEKEKKAKNKTKIIILPPQQG
jgi:hypothetical protein